MPLISHSTTIPPSSGEVPEWSNGLDSTNRLAGLDAPGYRGRPKGDERSEESNQVYRRRRRPLKSGLRVGEVPEWSNGLDSKSSVQLAVPWVRIPPSPPHNRKGPIWGLFSYSVRMCGRTHPLPLNSIRPRPNPALSPNLRTCANRYRISGFASKPTPQTTHPLVIPAPATQQ